jgi:hypothetical protein
VPKKYSRQAEIGDAGMQLIHRRISAMGFIWRPQPIADHGTDAQIETVDRATRTPLNQHLLVQSKASNRAFPGETEDSFHFDFEPGDVDYWESANLPVIVVCAHPDTDEAWWAPATRASRSSERRRVRIEFDKTRDRFDASAAPALLSLATNDTAPAAAVPTAKREHLVSNLIRIDDLPSTIWAAPTWMNTPRQIHAHLRTTNNHFNAWAFGASTLFAFEDPRQTGLGEIVDGSAEQIDVDEWAGSKDADVQRRFVRLLNGTVTDMLTTTVCRHKRGYLYFRPTEALEPMRVKVGGSHRTVFERYLSPEDESRVRNYRHYGLFLSFVTFGGSWFAEMQPTYHYTSDGFRDLPWSSDLLRGMKRREKNSAVRQLVEFWASYLRPSNNLFEDRPPIGFGGLVTFEVERGIHDRTWKAARESQEPSRRSGQKNGQAPTAPDSPQVRLF